MGVRRDLRRAGRRADLAARGATEVVRDASGTVREAHTAPLAPPLTTGSIADLPFTNATEAPDAVVLRRTARRDRRPVTARDFPARSPPPPRA